MPGGLVAWLLLLSDRSCQVQTFPRGGVGGGWADAFRGPTPWPFQRRISVSFSFHPSRSTSINDRQQWRDPFLFFFSPVAQGEAKWIETHPWAPQNRETNCAGALLVGTWVYSPVSKLVIIPTTPPFLRSMTTNDYWQRHNLVRDIQNRPCGHRGRRERNGAGTSQSGFRPRSSISVLRGGGAVPSVICSKTPSMGVQQDSAGTLWPNCDDAADLFLPPKIVGNPPGSGNEPDRKVSWCPQFGLLVYTQRFLCTRLGGMGPGWRTIYLVVERLGIGLRFEVSDPDL